MSIHPTAIVEDGASLAEGVSLGPYAIVGANVSLAEGVSVGSHAIVSGTTKVGRDCEIFPHAVIGGDAQDKKYAGEDAFLDIGERNVFREFATVNRGTMGGSTVIGSDNLFMAYTHVCLLYTSPSPRD